MWQAPHDGVEKATSVRRPSGATPRASHTGSAVRSALKRRALHHLMAITPNVTASATTTTIARRSGISGELELQAIEPRHHEAQRAEIDRGVEYHHDRDQRCKCPGHIGEPGYHETSAQQPDDPTEDARHAPGSVILFAFDAG